MSKKNRKFDNSDLIILGGFGFFSWGVYEAFGRSWALMVSGALLIVVGLLMAAKTSPRVPAGRNRS